MTLAEIVKLRELHAKATPGPWCVRPTSIIGASIIEGVADGDSFAHGRAFSVQLSTANAEFIFAVRSALPALLDLAESQQWRLMAEAPKQIQRSYKNAEYGPYILAWPVFGLVARVRWWQSKSKPEEYCNFLEDGGNAVRPTHFMPLPEPPKEER